MGLVQCFQFGICAAIKIRNGVMIRVWLIDNNMTSMECMVSFKSIHTLTLPTVTGRDFLVCHNVALVISFVAEKIPVFLPVWLRFLSPQ